MPDFRKYLLTTEEKVKEFKEKHSVRIGKNANAWTRWVNDLPEMRWCEFTQPGTSEEDAEFTVGLLCLLYINDRINIAFHDNTADSIRRVPW